MTCKCGSDRIISFNGKCNDMSCTSYKNMEDDGYVPDGLNIGSGDYVGFKFCADCGTIQNFKSLSDEDIAEALGYDNDDEE